MVLTVDSPRKKKILTRRNNVKELVFANDGITTKELGKLLGVSSVTICLDIHAIDEIHWIDCKVYAK